MPPYQPSRLAVGAIAFLALINLVRGAIHLFSTEGGLSDIAGLDIEQGREMTLFFIGAVGVGQITFAMIDFWVALRQRAFVLPLLVIHQIGLVLSLFLFFVQRPLPVVVLGQYGAVASFVIIGFITAREILLRMKYDKG
jgi:hypothetical protein